MKVSIEFDVLKKACGKHPKHAFTNTVNYKVCVYLLGTGACNPATCPLLERGGEGKEDAVKRGN